MMIEQVNPIASPSNNYFELLRDIHGACNNINQLVMKANRLDWLDKDEYKKNYENLSKLLLQIIKENTTPKKIVIQMKDGDMK